jgi:endonuclease-3
MRKAKVEEIEEAIRSGGLAKTKSQRIHNLLQAVHKEFGVTSLEHLRDRPTAEIKAALARYHGLGPKTISCVLLFTLGRDDFPVDTHVHRISNR